MQLDDFNIGDRIAVKTSLGRHRGKFAGIRKFPDGSYAVAVDLRRKRIHIPTWIVRKLGTYRHEEGGVKYQW